MKNKLKFISIILFVASFCNCAVAQTTDGEIIINGTMYHKVNHSTYYAFGEKNNHKLYEKQVSDSYGINGIIVQQSDVYLVDSEKTKVEEIVHSVFSKEELTKFRNADIRFEVHCAIDLEGNIMENEIYVSKSTMVNFINYEQLHIILKKVKDTIKFRVRNRVRDVYKITFAKQYFPIDKRYF